MKAKIKRNPTRITIPKYGKHTMLLLEYASFTNGIIKNVEMNENEFIVHINMSVKAAQSVKNYINNNS